MDNYTEQILDKKVSGKQLFVLAGAIAVTLAGVAMMLFVSFSMGFTVVIVGAVFIYFAKRMQSVEYEYLFINGDCEISKITSKSSRKKILTFDTGDVQRILPYESDKFTNELQVNSQLELMNLTSGQKFNKGMWYSFIVNSKGKTFAVILELNEKSLEHVNNYYKMKMDK